MVTIKEIAKRAGVSTATVSYVINGVGRVSERTRLRVNAIIEETGFKPNKMAIGLKTNSANTIGWIAEDINSDFIPAIICGITEYAEKHDLNVLLYDLHFMDKLYNRYENLVSFRNKVNESIGYLLDYHVNGIIYLAMNDRDVSGIIEPINKPLVYAYCYSSEKGSHSVSYDNEDASSPVMEYLYSKGHRNIAIIAGPKNSNPSIRRMSAVQTFLDSHTDVMVFTEYGNWEFADGKRIALDMLKKYPNFTALVAMNDLMATGAIEGLHENGKNLPDDISVIGFDDRDIASYFSPRLTTIALPLKEIGQQSVSMLLDLCKDGKAFSNDIRLQCVLVERESVRSIG